MRGISQCWQAELRPQGIRVTCICPSEVQTNFGGRTGRNNPNKLYADDIAGNDPGRRSLSAARAVDRAGGFRDQSLEGRLIRSLQGGRALAGGDNSTIDVGRIHRHTAAAPVQLFRRPPHALPLVVVCVVSDCRADLQRIRPARRSGKRRENAWRPYRDVGDKRLLAGRERAADSHGPAFCRCVGGWR